MLSESENWITESAILTEVRPDMVFNRWDVPKRIASDLVGLSAIPFSQNQAWSDDKHIGLLECGEFVAVIKGRQSFSPVNEVTKLFLSTLFLVFLFF